MDILRSFVTGLAFFGGLSSIAMAAECKNPDAIGLSRTIEIDPHAYPMVGKVQFMETLPLKDREIVLTFDDGPVEEVTESILNTLDDECVKATFFMIGIHAAESPELARLVYDRGHTVGFHTFSHPDVEKIPFEQAKTDIARGIGAVTEALGPLRKPAPFYRPPYLSMTNEVQRYLNDRGIMIWSIDADSNDWMFQTDDMLFQRTLAELEKVGKGILLMHDIQKRTTRVLPKLLRELKARGFKIVHVVPKQDRTPKTAGQLVSIATSEGWLGLSRELVSIVSTFISNTWDQIGSKLEKVSRGRAETGARS
jgi:peptidoglycan/xylan/chitin deacetylase (PgdA/CDA1 family)